jgi:hypothetical protein
MDVPSPPSSADLTAAVDARGVVHAGGYAVCGFSLVALALRVLLALHGVFRRSALQRRASQRDRAERERGPREKSDAKNAHQRVSHAINMRSKGRHVEKLVESCPVEETSRVRAFRAPRRPIPRSVLRSGSAAGGSSSRGGGDRGGTCRRPAGARPWPQAFAVDP